MSGKPASKICPNCGIEARADAKFCMKCGTALGKKASGKAGCASAASSAAADPTTSAAGAGTAPDKGSAYLKATAFDEGSVEARDALAAKAAKKAKADKSAAKGDGASGSQAGGNSGSQSKASKQVGGNGKATDGTARKRRKALIIAGSVVAALLLVLGIAALSAPKGTTDIGDGYEVTGQRIAFSNGSYVMTGSVKNTTGHNEAFTLTWQVFDKDEQEIGQASVSVGPLGDGESQEFTAQITSMDSMLDLFFSGGQSTQTASPDHFVLSDVTLYTESMGQLTSPFGGLFGFSDMIW